MNLSKDEICLKKLVEGKEWVITIYGRIILLAGVIGAAIRFVAIKKSSLQRLCLYVE
jgi:hypothetical protein